MSLDTHNSFVKFQAVSSQTITLQGDREKWQFAVWSWQKGEGGLGPDVGFGICGGVCPDLDS